jgi:hypothetical protein
LLEAINGLLTTDVVLVGETERYVVLTVRVPRDFIARNQHVIQALSDCAADIEIMSQPLPIVDDARMMQVPFGLVGSDADYVLFTMRISRPALAAHHGALVAVSGFAA